MGEQVNEKMEKKRVMVESLGWLTESTIMPKKHKPIEGVGASSIFELKAQLYKSQEEARKSRELAGPDVEYQRAKKIITPNDAFSHKNSGVEARSHRDKLALKAEQDGSNSYAALEKKAILYEKLVKGELSDEEEQEKYSVDFLSKGLMQDERPHQKEENTSAAESTVKGDRDEDAFAPFSAKPGGLGRAAGNFDFNEHRRFVREVHEEVTEAREKASELKMRRQEQAASRREKLKQAYLKKQIEKLKTNAKNEQS